MFNDKNIIVDKNNLILLALNIIEIIFVTMFESNFYFRRILINFFFDMNFMVSIISY